MPKPILIKPDAKLERQIKEAARSEKRKPGPMAVILLERYFATSEVEAQDLPHKKIDGRF